MEREKITGYFSLLGDAGIEITEESRNVMKGVVGSQ